jgi:hypothetical protein
VQLQDVPAVAGKARSDHRTMTNFLLEYGQFTLYNVEYLQFCKYKRGGIETIENPAGWYRTTSSALPDLKIKGGEDIGQLY